MCGCNSYAITFTEAVGSPRPTCSCGNIVQILHVTRDWEVLLRVILATFIVIFTVSIALADKRVALVFGSDRYEHIRPLSNAVNDARAVEDTLDELGFEVTSESNRNLRQMRRALEEFADTAAGADVALVFFAGHGVEIAGENRLLPTDASSASLEALNSSSLPLNEIQQTISQIAKIGLILLDACRDDPFATASDPHGRGVKALNLPDIVRPGLGRLGKAENTLFAFSAAPGKTASDGEGGNSPFTSALVKFLGTDGLEIRSVLTLVRQEVYDRTRGSQIPYVEDGLPEIFFAEKTGDLPERERLLLAMAEVSPEIREEVEQVALQSDTPLAPLYGALISSNMSQLSSSERVVQLTDVADQFNRVRNELRNLRSEDENVAKLRDEAEAQLAIGAFDTARAKLRQAADIDEVSRQALKANFVGRTFSKATTYAVSGGTARAQREYNLALEDYRQAVSLFEEIIDEDLPPFDRYEHFYTLHDIGELALLIGDLSESHKAYGDALEVIGMIVEDDPDNQDWLRAMSVAYEKMGDVQANVGDEIAALQSYDESLLIAERLADLNPNDEFLKYDLSVAFGKVGDIRMKRSDFDAALLSYESALKLSEQLVRLFPEKDDWMRKLSTSYEDMGHVMLRKGNIEAARDFFTENMNIRAQLYETQADTGIVDTGAILDLSIAQGHMIDIFMELGDFDQALDYAENVITMREIVSGVDPQDVSRQRALAFAHLDAGKAHAALQNSASALSSFNQSLVIVEKLAAIDPENFVAQHDLMAINSNIGSLHYNGEELTEALDAYGRVLVIAQETVNKFPEDSRFQLLLSQSFENVGMVQLDLEMPREALVSYRRSLAIIKELGASDPEATNHLSHLAELHSKIGYALYFTDEFDEALNSHRAGLRINERLVGSDPGNSKWVRQLANSFEAIGNHFVDSDQDSSSNLMISNWTISLEKNVSLLSTDQDDAELRSDILVAVENIGLFYAEDGHTDAALKHYGNYLSLAEQLGATAADSFSSELKLTSQCGIGEVMESNGNIEEAIPAFQKCIDAAKTLVERFPDHVSYVDFSFQDTVDFYSQHVEDLRNGN